MLEPATAGESLQVSRCRPFHGLRAYFCDPILGLAPQALCCRSLRELCLRPRLHVVARSASFAYAPGFMLSLAPRALLTPQASCCRSLRELCLRPRLHVVARSASFAYAPGFMLSLAPRAVLT